MLLVPSLPYCLRRRFCVGLHADKTPDTFVARLRSMKGTSGENFIDAGRCCIPSDRRWGERPGAILLLPLKREDAFDAHGVDGFAALVAHFRRVRGAGTLGEFGEGEDEGAAFLGGEDDDAEGRDVRVHVQPVVHV
ncbi:hypothetical protein KC356_g214 [Hortaea werneckii]|nr:hypothetical protein KC356_g214 [Hortaea werneckii]